MPVETNPVYRKVIVPWYDTEAACLVTILFLFVVFLLAFTGISVAWESDRFRNHFWVPGVLIAFSTITIVSITFRLVKRYFSQR